MLMLVVVGGQSRKVGKTTVVEALIRALPEARWTAVKVTPHHHGAPALLEQREPDTTDSGRYLAAGAARSFLLSGPLKPALPALRRILAASENVIIESNSVLEFLNPDLYLAVVDPAAADVKASSRRYAHRADASIAAPGVIGAEIIALVRAKLKLT